jgi:hypothetical protein
MLTQTFKLMLALIHLQAIHMKNILFKKTIYEEKFGYVSI